MQNCQKTKGTTMMYVIECCEPQSEWHDGIFNFDTTFLQQATIEKVLALK